MESLHTVSSPAAVLIRGWSTTACQVRQVTHFTLRDTDGGVRMLWCGVRHGNVMCAIMQPSGCIMEPPRCAHPDPGNP
jgi:hypothetical protein